MIVEIDDLAANNQAMLDDARPLTPEQKTLAENFTKALEEDGAPTPGDIADRCDVTEQAVSNWKRTGKITKKNIAIVSEMTGWSVHRLMTGSDAPSGQRSHARQVSESDWATLQAVKLLISERELEDMRARHARLKAQALQEVEDAARAKDTKR